MTSLYNPTALQPHTSARSQDVNAEHAKIKAAIDQLQAAFASLASGTVVIQPLYTWRAYANSSNGRIDFTIGEPGGRSYIGFAFNQLVPEFGEDPDSYEWSPIAGALGNFIAFDTLNVAGRSAINLVGDFDSLASSLLAYQFDRQTLRDYVDGKLYVDGKAVNTVIVEERNTRETETTALAETIALIGAKTPDGGAFVIDLTKTYVDPTTTLAVRLSTIQSEAADAQASVQDLAQAIVTANYATASDLSLLGAKTPDGSAWQMNLGTVRVSPTQSFAQYINQAVASAAGGAASVSQIFEAVISPVTGASAKAVLNLDVNGRVASMTATNDGTTSKVVYSFDSFELRTPAGQSMFLAVGGLVKMANVEIDTLKVGSVTTGALAAEAVNNTEVYERPGPIVLAASQPRTIGEVTITKTSATSYMEIFAFTPAFSDNDINYTADLYRGDTKIKTFKVMFVSDQGQDTADTTTLFHIDRGLAAGTYTYRLDFTADGSQNWGLQTVTVGALIKVTEVKR